MSFPQAVFDGFSKYASFSGRSPRSAYWWWTLFAFIVGVASYTIGLAIDSLALYYVLALALFLPGLAVSVRRLHDIGRSGWWYLIVIVPIVGALIVIFWTVQPSEGDNKYGAAPTAGVAHV